MARDLAYDMRRSIDKTTNMSTVENRGVLACLATFVKRTKRMLILLIYLSGPEAKLFHDPLYSRVSSW